MAGQPQSRSFVVEDLYNTPDDGLHYELIHGCAHLRHRLHSAPLAGYVRGPDVAFVKRERYKALEDPDKAIPGAPDLAVEVLSLHNRQSEIHGKVADYLAAGTAVVWVIDPANEQIAVYRTLLKPTLLGSDDELTAEELLPGFRVRVGSLFET